MTTDSGGEAAATDVDPRGERPIECRAAGKGVAGFHPDTHAGAAPDSGADMPQAHAVARLSELKPGTGKLCEVAGKSIALLRTADGFRAIDNECGHRGGPLAEGFLEGDVVTCPWHGWQYDMKTGQCLNMEGCRLGTYPVSVEGDVVTILI